MSLSQPFAHLGLSHGRRNSLQLLSCTPTVLLRRQKITTSIFVATSGSLCQLGALRSTQTPAPVPRPKQPTLGMVGRETDYNDGDFSTVWYLGLKPHPLALLSVIQSGQQVRLCVPTMTHWDFELNKVINLEGSDGNFRPGCLNKATCCVLVKKSFRDINRRRI